MGRKPVEKDKKHVRIDISMPPATLERLNIAADVLEKPRSKIIETAVTKHLDDLGIKKPSL